MQSALIALSATIVLALATPTFGAQAAPPDDHGAARIAQKRAGAVQTRFIVREAPEYLSRFYPERAQRLGISESATVTCQATAAGSLEDCRITSETPADAGFGAAALLVAQSTKVAPKDKDGDPLEGLPIVIPLNWSIPR